MTTRLTGAPSAHGFSTHLGHAAPLRASNGRGGRLARAKGIITCYAGETLNRAFLFRVLLMGAVACVAVWLLGQPDRGEFAAGERAVSSVWSDRTLEVPDPVATELEKIRAQSAVVPIFVQDDMIPSRVMSDTRRIFREGRRLIREGASELPGEFVADFYAVFRGAPPLESAGSGDGTALADAAAATLAAALSEAASADPRSRPFMGAAARYSPVALAPPGTPPSPGGNSTAAAPSRETGPGGRARASLSATVTVNDSAVTQAYAPDVPTVGGMAHSTGATAMTQSYAPDVPAAERTSRGTPDARAATGGTPGASAPTDAVAETDSAVAADTAVADAADTAVADAADTAVADATVGGPHPPSAGDADDGYGTAAESGPDAGDSPDSTPARVIVTEDSADPEAGERGGGAAAGLAEADVPTLETAPLAGHGVATAQILARASGGATLAPRGRSTAGGARADMRPEPRAGPTPVASDASGPGTLVRKAAAEGFSERLEQSVNVLAVELLGQGLVAESPDAPVFQGRQVTLSRPGARPSAVNYDSFLTMARARSFIAARARMRAAEILEDPSLIADLVVSAVRPNVTLDIESYAERVTDAVANVAPVVYRVKKGDQVIKQGEPVSPRTMIVLEALSAGRDKGWWIKRSFGLLVILLVFLTVTQAIAGMERRRLDRTRETILMSFLLMWYILLAWASTNLGEGLEKGFGLGRPVTLFLAMPMPGATMLSVIFLGNRRSVPVAFLGALLAAALAPMETFEAFVYVANGSLVAVLHLRHLSERGRFLSSSLMCSLINVLTIVGLSLMDGRSALTLDLAAGAISGMLSGILASGLVPAVELAMGFTTNLKLMELGNLNRPLLRELMLAAPGTYHHSVIVGSMVEAAAEAIGAPPHLARVGAYYHDIGKIRKPLYFIENQAGENRHDSLTPTMSVLILVGHVKDGVEIARAHKLPPEVTDIVEQHHGTSLMSFFLHKAIEQRSPNSPPVNPGDFRYPGPKPASKEAGLVMLADICEAATRSLTEPTPVKIQELVRALINRIFDDGQLDASELILKDLTETMRIFTNILVGIYHHRVTYPVLSKDQVNNQAARSKVIYGNISQEPAQKRVAH
ncbi:MAG: HDIG domain-containing protein [Deltaproteobacteria bacterium]|jgi:putative nucleotidyltransferase with HDIG domain|nr:HDIG domain-containing protein [Deltaproteobacteria bacterium]